MRWDRVRCAHLLPILPIFGAFRYLGKNTFHSVELGSNKNAKKQIFKLVRLKLIKPRVHHHTSININTQVQVYLRKILNRRSTVLCYS